MPEELPALVVGEALVDLVRPADGGADVEHVGGSPANVARGLARLGHGVVLATHLGADARGDRIEAELAADGVRLTAGSRGAERTSTALATLDTSGAAQYEFALDWQHDASSVDDTGVGHVHTGSIGATLEPGGSQVLGHLHGLRAGHTISYDPNARPTLMGTPAAVRERLEAVTSLADIVKCSDQDLDWFYPELGWQEGAAHLATLGPRLVVVTAGGSGAHVRWVRGDDSAPVSFTMASPRVAVVDTVGAGDSFMAGLLSGLLDAGLLGGAGARAAWASPAAEAAVRAAVARGIATGAWTVQRAGAGGPTRADLGA